MGKNKNVVLIGISAVVFVIAGVLIVRSLSTTGPAPTISEEAAAGAAAAAQTNPATQDMVEPATPQPRGSGRLGVRNP